MKVSVWSWNRCRIDSWVIGCIQLRVLYAGDVYGVTLGDAVWVVCGGIVTTLGEGVTGWQGWWSDHCEVVLP